MGGIIKKIFHRGKKKNVAPIPDNLFVSLMSAVTDADIAANRRLTQRMKTHVWRTPPTSFMFFTLCCTDFLAGGFKTHMDLIYAIYKKLHAKIYVCLVPEPYPADLELFYAGLKKYYPDLQLQVLSIDQAHNTDTDVCIALNVATIEAIRYNRCREKYLHAMDYEPMFFASGVESAIFDFIYSQGFFTFTNSMALKKIYSDMNPGTPVFRYVPGIDSIYFGARPARGDDMPRRIVVYARPAVPRNAFALLVPVFKSVKREFGDNVEIILVGQNFDVERYGLAGICTNLGKLNSLDDLAALYKTCDMGISLITTPTFSYMHLQLMASGACLVTNGQSGVGDLLVDGENAVVVPPVPSIMADRICQLLRRPDRLQKIARNGRQTVAEYNWDKCFDSIIDFIVGPKD